MTATVKTMMNLLSARFPHESISWLPKNIVRQDGKFIAMALAYIDARDVMRRLDEVCGPANWQDEYCETGRGRMICTLRIRIGKDWIAKSDGSGDSEIESEKGGISGAFKRAAVKWGIGRYLYELDTPWAECEVTNSVGGLPEFKCWTPRGRARLKQSLIMNPSARFPTFEHAFPALPPDVSDFLIHLEKEIRAGNGNEYWESNFPNLASDWKNYVAKEKDRLKFKISSANAANTTQTRDTHQSADKKSITVKA